MALPGFCESEITASCLVRNTTLQIFIGDVPITNPFPVNTTDNQLTLQASITSNTIGVGVTITVQNDSVFPLTCQLGNEGFLHLLVQVASTTQITDALIVTDFNEGYNTINTTQFICNLTPVISKRHKKRKLGALPILCVEKTYGKNGQEINNEKISYRGRIYQKVSDNGRQMCYIITNNRI